MQRLDRHTGRRFADDLPWTRRSWWIALLALGAGAALRLYFLFAYPAVQGDSLVYGDIAKNWLLHGVFGRSGGGHIVPTLIRLPGYPLFLAVCFRLFGVEHYNPPVFIQIGVDLFTCVLAAALACRIRSRRAGWIALWAAALCPFTANYAAAPLTEALELFCTMAAFYAMARFVDDPGRRWVLALAFCWSYATLLRPDGALVAVATFPALYFYGRHRWGGWRVLRAATLAGVLALLPFVAWTIRNWRTFGVFEPLAPRYAVDPGESALPGFNRWTKTVCADLACTWEVYWNADSDVIDPATLPARAFDTTAQRAATLDLLRDYNRVTTIGPALDRRFAVLAAQRIRAHPLRYYVELPLARLADMWLRPRTEMLWIELRWWQYDKHPAETVFAWSYAALNLAYLLAALAGLLRRPPFWGAMLAFVLLRCALLATLEAPEPRYTLECFPLVFVLAGIGLGGRRQEPAG
jgi:hypothetical protein